MASDKTIRALKVEQYLKDNPVKKATKDQFIELFILCEMECKDAILDHWHSCGRKLDVVDTDGIRLRPDSIKNALGPSTEFSFQEEFLLRLFGGNDNSNNPYKRKGLYSAKILRDKITHELLITAIEEVCDRKDELFELMKAFRKGYEDCLKAGEETFYVKES